MSRYEVQLVGKVFAIIDTERGTGTGRYFMRFGEATAECDRLNAESGR